MTRLEIKNKLASSFTELMTSYNLRDLVGLIMLRKNEIVFNLTDIPEMQQHLLDNPVILEDIFTKVLSNTYVARSYIKYKNDLPSFICAVLK